MAKIPLLRIALVVLPCAIVAAPARAGGDPEERRSPVVRVVEKARSPTVAIHTTHIVYPRYRRTWFDVDLPEPYEQQGLGSGTIFHPDGYVITNAHVIARASKILVDITHVDEHTRAEETIKREGRIVAVDTSNDLAILRLVTPEGEDPMVYPHLTPGRSNDLMLGESVIAVGNPFGLGFTVTTGVLGGTNRRFPLGGNGGASFADFLQIDAAINPGNSGGPLLDITGEWIGVTTAILNRSRLNAEGVGIAIPIDRVRSLIGRAFKRRVLAEDWTGVEMEEGERSTPRVKWVFPRGPAVDSGLQPGDVVESVAGSPTPTLYDFQMAMASVPGLRPVTWTVKRGGEGPRKVVVPLRPVPTDELSRKHLGFRVIDVTEEMEIGEAVPLGGGVLVDEIDPDSPAARIHLRPNDLVMGLGGWAIHNSDDLLVFLQYVQPGDVVNVVVQRPSTLPNGQREWAKKEGALVAR
jgi:serine protease Do